MVMILKLIYEPCSVLSVEESTNGFIRFLTFGRILEIYAAIWREKKSGIQKPGLSSFSPSFSYLIGNNFWRKRPGLVVKKPLPRTILGVIR